MKRWAALTVLLYLLCLSACVVPLLYFLADGDEDAFAAFYLWVVPVMLVVQVVLLMTAMRRRSGFRPSSLGPCESGSLP